MSRIRCANTMPEVAVRSILHRMGFRFRKSSSHRLPGRPDVVLPKHHAAVLVHGCFWHRHAKCRLAYTPKSRTAFWGNKFAGNIRRDAEVRRLLRQAGWRVIVVWECQLKRPDEVARRLASAIAKRVPAHNVKTS
jgi:DNA mismatch endonuclease, patch repair protein